MRNKRQKTPNYTAVVRENERLQTELRAVRGSRLATNLGLIGKELVKWLGIALVVWLGVGQIAGKSTTLDVDAAIDVCGSLTEHLKELASGWIFELASMLLVAAAVASNRRLRRLNKKLSKRLGELTRDYEVEIDPGRSTSGLGSDGETHERDQT